MTPEEIAAKFLDDEEDVPRQPARERRPRTREDIARKYLEVAPAAEREEPAPKPEAGPGFLDRTRDRLQLGLSDAMSSIAGDTYGRSGDPTERDDLPFAGYMNVFEGRSPTRGGRLTKALGGDILPAVADVAADAFTTAMPESAQRGLAKTMEWMKGNLEGTPYEGSDVLGEVARQAEALGGPETRATVEELGMVASLAAPTVLSKAMRATEPGRRLADAGNDVLGDLERSRQRMVRGDIAQRWRPPEANIGPGRSTTRRTRKNVYEPTERELRMYDEIQDVPGLDPRAPFVDNFNALSDEVERLRRKLDSDLRFAQRLPEDRVRGLVQDSADSLKKSASMQGDAAAVGGVILDKFNEMVDEAAVAGVVRPGDLLQIRRDLDSWVTAGRGRAFDGATLNAQQIALKEIRDRINDMVAEAADSVDVRDSLRKQSDLLTARDMIEKQTIVEPPGPVGRFVTDVERQTGLAAAQTPLAAISNVQSPLAMALAAAGATYTRGGRALRNAMRYGGAGTEKALQQAILASRGPLSLAAMNEIIEDEEEPPVPYRR